MPSNTVKDQGGHVSGPERQKRPIWRAKPATSYCGHVYCLATPRNRSEDQTTSLDPATANCRLLQGFDMLVAKGFDPGMKCHRALLKPLKRFIRYPKML